MQKVIGQKKIGQKSMEIFSIKNSLLAKYFPQFTHLTLLKFITISLIGSLFITIGAKINIPLYPVSTTMQTLAVMILGCVFGSRLALASVIAYLAEGFCGIPVFMGSLTGPLYFVGPTAGFLVGFMLSAYGVGVLYERGFAKKSLSTIAIFIFGAILIDIPGIAWVYYLTNAATAKSVYLSYQLAFILKTGLAAFSVTLLGRNAKQNPKNTQQSQS